jgi:hypothetical protein
MGGSADAPRAAKAQLVSSAPLSGGAMYVIREILNCKPGKVRPVIASFELISKAIEEMGKPPMRLMTDVSGEPFWTLVIEATVERIEDFFEMEAAVMANESIRSRMADFHDLIQGGRREIFRTVARESERAS